MKRFLQRFKRYTFMTCRHATLPNPIGKDVNDLSESDH